MGLFDSIKKAFSFDAEVEEKQNSVQVVTLYPQNQVNDEEDSVLVEQVDENVPSDEQNLEPVEDGGVDEQPEAEVVVAGSSEVDAIQDAETESETANEAEHETASELKSETLNESEPEVTQESETQSDTNLDAGLTQTKKSWSERWNAFMANFRSVDEDFFEELEETLIKADVGAETAFKLTEELRDEVKLQNAKSRAEVSNVVLEKLVDHYEAQGVDEDASMHFATEGPTVILFVGVNGVGKTTTIGKLAARYKGEGKKVLLAAADTFRAGATQQLQEWGKRDEVTVIAGAPNSDPASVVFDGVKAAIEQQADILFVDTAGRLQNNVNLMLELEKMKRIIARELPAEPTEVLLVLDSTTGQNALQQAKLFKDSTDVTGIVLTKLDGTAKGGIILPIRNELHLPVKWIGLGEQVGDLQPFEANEFAKSLFGQLVED